MTHMTQLKATVKEQLNILINVNKKESVNK